MQELPYKLKQKYCLGTYAEGVRVTYVRVLDRDEYSIFINKNLKDVTKVLLNGVEAKEVLASKFGTMLYFNTKVPISKNEKRIQIRYIQPGSWLDDSVYLDFESNFY